MLISYRHRFIFVHVYKVAGSSVYSALRPYADEPGQPWPARMLSILGVELRRPLRMAYRHKGFDDHIWARELITDLSPSVFRRFYSFAFVRNPWDWQVSLYHYGLQNQATHHHALFKSFGSFDRYLEWRVAKDCKLQADFVTDDHGRLIVDFVGRMENLEADFGEVLQHIGIDVDLPHTNPSRHEDYRSYYSDYSRHLVADAFREDIERFQYGFDGPLTTIPLRRENR